MNPNVSPEKPLTGKQAKFAQAVASGKTRAQARRENYASSPPGYEQSDRRKASELARQPNVAAEIRRLTWLSMPVMDDFRGMRGQAIRVISDLSRTAKSEEVRLRAALALLQIAEHHHAAAAPDATPQDQDRILSALRQLYGQAQLAAAQHQKANPGYQPPPMVSDAEEVIDIQALGDPAPAPPEPDQH